MSLYSMPVLIMNLGGEMMYILEQRLQAQSIPNDKSRKVMQDIIRTMYNAKFMAELFKPQEVYSPSSTRQIFDRIAHSSIMRLSESSMEKLYDLMTMGFKYQLVCCSHPGELLTITMNHLQTLRQMVISPDVVALLESAQQYTRSTLGLLDAADFVLLRQTLCSFFQDKRVKVSLFLQDGIQNMDGSMVQTKGGALPFGVGMPGSITYFDKTGAKIGTARVDLPNAHLFTVSDGDSPGLGCNIYARDRKPATTGTAATGSAGPAAASDSPVAKPGFQQQGPSPSKQASIASAELNLLSALIGADKPKEDNFKINLFPDPTPSGGGGGPSVTGGTQMIYIERLTKPSKELSQLMSDMDVKSESGAGGDDLLDLMDSVA